MTRWTVRFVHHHRARVLPLQYRHRPPRCSVPIIQHHAGQFLTNPRHRPGHARERERAPTSAPTTPPRSRPPISHPPLPVRLQPTACSSRRCAQLANMTSGLRCWCSTPIPWLDGGSVMQLMLISQRAAALRRGLHRPPTTQYLAWTWPSQAARPAGVLLARAPTRWVDLYLLEPHLQQRCKHHVLPAPALRLLRPVLRRSRPPTPPAPATGLSCLWTKVAQSTAMRSLTRVNSADHLHGSCSPRTTRSHARPSSRTTTPSTGPRTTSTVACTWLQNNTATIWQAWIAPPFACGLADMAYTRQPAATQAATRMSHHVVASTYPQACVGGHRRCRSVRVGARASVVPSPTPSSTRHRGAS